jgi:hypothetical protein
MVDPQTLALNFALIIGGTILLIVGSFALYALWTCINMGIWVMQRRRAQREYLRASRRADGKLYPPYIAGRCSRCGRGNDRIYFTPTGQELCPTCYEIVWREEEGLMNE